MTRVLITGMSGTGKTTLLDELGRRGHLTVDTDYGGWVRPDGTWDEARMGALLAEHRDLFIAGTVENQGRFYDRLLRQGAWLELDARLPVAELADLVEAAIS